MPMRSSSLLWITRRSIRERFACCSRTRVRLRCRVLKAAADIPCCSIASWSRKLLLCETSARDVIRAHDPVYVDVDDPGILEDVDDPASYARLQECSR